MSAFLSLFWVLAKAVEFLTADRLVLGAALRDVGAEHCAYSRVRREAPGEFLAIWISTVVFSQVPVKQRHSYPVVCLNKCMQVGE